MKQSLHKQVLIICYVKLVETENGTLDKNPAVWCVSCVSYPDIHFVPVESDRVLLALLYHCCLALCPCH